MKHVENRKWIFCVPTSSAFRGVGWLVLFSRNRYSKHVQHAIWWTRYCDATACHKGSPGTRVFELEQRSSRYIRGEWRKLFCSYPFKHSAQSWQRSIRARNWGDMHGKVFPFSLSFSKWSLSCGANVSEHHTMKLIIMQLSTPCHTNSSLWSVILFLQGRTRSTGELLFFSYSSYASLVNEYVARSCAGSASGASIRFRGVSDTTRNWTLLNIRIHSAQIGTSQASNNSCPGSSAILTCV